MVRLRIELVHHILRKYIWMVDQNENNTRMFRKIQSSELVPEPGLITARSQFPQNRAVGVIFSFAHGVSFIIFENVEHIMCSLSF